MQKIFAKFKSLQILFKGVCMIKKMCKDVNSSLDRTKTFAKKCEKLLKSPWSYLTNFFAKILILKEWTYLMYCNYFLSLNGFLSEPFWKCKIYLFLFSSWFPIYVIRNKLGLFQQCQLIIGKISRISLQTSILTILLPYLEKLYINMNNQKLIFCDKQILL